MVNSTLMYLLVCVEGIFILVYLVVAALAGLGILVVAISFSSFAK